MGMSLLGSRNVVVKRTTPGAYSDATGFFTPGVSSELTIQASVQPLTARDLQQLAEGNRTRETIKLYTSSELLTDDEAGQSADRVVWNGQSYKVISVWNWQLPGGMLLNHWKVIAINDNPADQDAAVGGQQT